MYTQCPHCQTCFRISEAHLKVAEGKVRCGSCQEVFDATQHLFKNLTDREPITDFKLPSTPAAPPPPQAKPMPPREPRPAPPPRPTSPPPPPPTANPAPRPSAAEHIDLASPPAAPAQTLEDIRRERAQTPDQGHFMESTVGGERYNDLDKMGSISIPGDISFGDSIIKFPEDEEPEKQNAPTAAAKPAENRTPYEDFEDKETPATTADHDSIKDFYAQVDAQLNSDPDDNRTQLDKDIDELLAFAKGLDSEPSIPEQTPQDEKAESPQEPANTDIEEEFDLKAIEEFEKELEASNSDVFATHAAQGHDSLTGNHDKKAAAVNKTTAESKPAEAKAKISDEPESFPEPATEPAGTDSGQPVKHDEPPEQPSPDEDIPRALRASLESLNDLPRRSLGQTLLMLLVIILLIGGLGFQTVLFRNVELAQRFPQLIPLLTKVCTQLPCRYSGKVDVSQIKLISRDVRSHPSQSNALLISAAFTNEAPFDQPYPIIQITLYDLGGNVVASRRFTPQEYLADMYNRFLLMESGTPVHITLAVLDPGKDAINFEFTFLQDLVH